MREAVRRGLGRAAAAAAATAAAALVVLSATGVAWAQAPAPGGTAPAGAQGGATGGGSVADSYNKGLAAANKGDWQQAYDAFLAAWQMKQLPEIAANLGRVELKLGKHRDAAEHLQYFLNEAKDTPPANRTAVQQLLQEAKGKIATLLVKSNRPGAEVLVDGKVVGQAPLAGEVYVDPGPHTVEARLGAEKVDPVAVDVGAGQSRQVGLTFGTGGAAPAQNPMTPGDVAPGPEGGPSTPLLIAGFATAGVGIIAGISFTAMAIDAANVTYNQADEKALLSNVAFWSFAGAGLVAGATVAYMVLAPRGNPPGNASVRVVPAAATNGGGLWLSGQW